MSKLIRSGLVALAVLLLPAGLLAQQPTAPAAPNQQEVQAWFLELQQISAKLNEIQMKALQDPKLQAEQEALGTEVKTAMDKIDPGLSASVERVKGLEQEAMQAQQSGNEAKLKELAAEAQQIQTRFMNVQNQALQQPELAKKIEDFQTRLETRMVEIDPAARGLIQRLLELETKLQTAMQSGS